MTFQAHPEALLQDVLSACSTAGADAADAGLVTSHGISVSVRENKLETIERDEAASLSLRAFFGQRQAHVSGSDLSKNGLSALVDRVVAMAKVAPEDPYAGLAPSDDLLRSNRDLEMPGDGEPSPEHLETNALACEAAALGIDGVVQVTGAGAGWGARQRWVAASNGFASFRSSEYSSVGVAAIAQRDGEMERDYESWTTRFEKHRPSAADIGKTAGERAVARLGGMKLPSRSAHVIYDRRLSSSLLGAFTSAISGNAIARGVSYLKDSMGQQVFAEGVEIIDDPDRVDGMGNRAHDGEGRPVRRTKFIEDGRLTQWMLNGPAAKQLKLTPNGFASPGFGDPPGIGGSNMYIAAGTKSQSELMADAGAGLLVTDMFGPSINPNTGDYSVGVAGFWFENGEIVHPVKEVTIAGDLLSMFSRMVPGSDLEFRGSRDAPSILVPDMSLAGA